jgi:GNAT superfamily N-acetyltransferase
MGIDDHACEMKRMFVYPEFHGKGIGHASAQALEKLKRKNYIRVLVLKILKPYYELPEKLKTG